MVGTIPPQLTAKRASADAQSAFADQDRASQIGWLLYTCQWANISGSAGRMLAANVDNNLIDGVINQAQKSDVVVKQGPSYNDSRTTLVIEGDDNIRHFHEVRAKAGRQFAREVAKAPWNGALPVDNVSDDIILTVSKGIETGAIIEGWNDHDRQRLLTALNIMDISYVVDRSAGQDAVFIVNPEHAERVDMICETHARQPSQQPAVKNTHDL